MSHGGPGYYYLSYQFKVPYKGTDGKTHIDDTYYSAVYTAVKKQSHQGQTDWRNDKAMPAIKNDINKNFDAYRNKQGKAYEPYSEKYVKTIEFMYCETLPKHINGPLKGQAYGNEIK